MRSKYRVSHVNVIGRSGGYGYKSWPMVDNNYYSSKFAENVLSAGSSGASSPTMTKTIDLTRCKDIKPRPL